MLSFVNWVQVQQIKKILKIKKNCLKMIENDYKLELNY